VLLLVAAGITTYRMGWLSGVGRRSANSKPKGSVTGGSVPGAGGDATASPTVENAPANVPRESAPEIGGATDSGIAAAGTKKNEPRTSNARPSLPSGNKGATTTSATKRAPENGPLQADAYVPPK